MPCLTKRLIAQLIAHNWLSCLLVFRQLLVKTVNLLCLKIVLENYLHPYLTFWFAKLITTKFKFKETWVQKKILFLFAMAPGDAWIKKEITTALKKSHQRRVWTCWKKEKICRESEEFNCLIEQTEKNERKKLTDSSQIRPVMKFFSRLSLRPSYLNIPARPLRYETI